MLSRAATMTSGTAASLLGAMTWQPATPGISGKLAHHVDTDAAALGVRIGRAFEAIDDRLRNDGAEQLVADPQRRLHRAQRHNADQQRNLVGNAVLGEPCDVAAHHAGIHAELGLHELRAGAELGLERGRLPVRRRIDRVVGGAEKKRGAPGHLAPRGQFAGVAQFPRRFQERARIDVEYGLGIRLVTGARIVAAQHQQIVNAARRRTHEVALQGNTVAVTAGHLQDRLDPLADQDRRCRERCQMRPGAGAVGDIDGVGQALERQGFGEKLVAVGGNRRGHFRGDDKALLAQLFLEGHGGQAAESSGPCKHNNGKNTCVVIYAA